MSVQRCSFWEYGGVPADRLIYSKLVEKAKSPILIFTDNIELMKRKRFSKYAFNVFLFTSHRKCLAFSKVNPPKKQRR